MNSTMDSIPINLHVGLIIAFSYSLTVNLPANASVLWLILREARLAPDIFYFSLSSEEILTSLSMIWTFISVQYSCMPCLEPFAFFQGLFFTARPLFQFLICLECYVGVIHPVLFLCLKPLRYRLTCCVIAWLLIFASCLFYNYIFKNLLLLFTFFVQNLLILFALLFFLLSVLWTLKCPAPGGNNAQKKSSRTKTRAFKILLVTMASTVVHFLLCIMPIPLQFSMPQQRFVWVYNICISLSLIIGSMQPLIYLQRAEKILCLQLH